MKGYISIFLFLLSVGFLESIPKHYIVETEEGTTKATDKDMKPHGCVDSSGRKYREDDILENSWFDNKMFDTVCGCYERKPSLISKKECRWQVESFGWFGNTTNNKPMIINNEEECKGQCHIPEDYEDVYYAEWLNAECLEECSEYVKKGFITKQEIYKIKIDMDGLKTGNTLKISVQNYIDSLIYIDAYSMSTVFLRIPSTCS